MIVRKLGLQRAWSQGQLAELTGLNVRTIQRIERGQKHRTYLLVAERFLKAA